MDRIIIAMFAFILLLSLNTGCLDNTPSSSSYKFIVDVSYTQSTPGWNTTRFNSIQAAINALPNNITIFVHSGIYHENIVIEKNVTLIGEDVNTTIISGDMLKKDVIQISPKGRATIVSFTIENSGYNGKHCLYAHLIYTKIYN